MVFTFTSLYGYILITWYVFLHSGYVAIKEKKGNYYVFRRGPSSEVHNTAAPSKKYSFLTTFAPNMQTALDVTKDFYPPESDNSPTFRSLLSSMNAKAA